MPRLVYERSYFGRLILAAEVLAVHRPSVTSPLRAPDHTRATLAVAL